MKRTGLSTMLLSFALTVMCGLGTAQGLETTTFDLVSRNKGCLPDAAGQVTVLHKEEALGVDTLLLRASGLPANTEFTVFLTAADAFATPPFGASEYIGDFITNAAGRGSLKVDTIIGEAFASTVSGTPPARVRADLDHVVIWFADPNDAPACFGVIKTPFDGDGVAGPTVLSSQGPTGLEAFP
jgi:hypothetical protein